MARMEMDCILKNLANLFIALCLETITKIEIMILIIIILSENSLDIFLFCSICISYMANVPLSFNLGQL